MDNGILVIPQVVTVGVVGGSDLSKITEQLGSTGIYFHYCVNDLLVRASKISGFVTDIIEHMQFVYI